eukprot:TRINITY_DN12055_c0_g1_i2.p1 TRINITY_DN12055_c0_g1~~TRINITY_DN12055_c0_g1_i2.p1  ORF type:complete len:179 (-),score=60.19 TRINITY_DN12055_c0_g1_i2:128-604(-)
MCIRDRQSTWAGTGRILTSKATVHGKDTKFMKELENGDKIIIMHPTTLAKEERKIKAVLSDRSLMIDEPFSSDLISFTHFDYQKKPIFKEADATLDEQYREKLNTLSKSIQKPTSTLEYREKKGMWGYKTVTKKVEGELTREQLLDMRSKKSRDKFCW